MDDLISRQAAIELIHSLYPSAPIMRMNRKQWEKKYKPYIEAEKALEMLPSAQSKITKEYDLKKIYNIYVKIAQAHFMYQPSKPKTITAMPFDWIETQNLLEKYLKDNGADFDVLCREYISENMKNDHLPLIEPEIIRCKDCKYARKWRDEESAKKFGQIYECARGVLNCPKPEDFCSHAERKTDE